MQFVKYLLHKPRWFLILGWMLIFSTAFAELSGLHVVSLYYLPWVFAGSAALFFLGLITGVVFLFKEGNYHEHTVVMIGAMVSLYALWWLVRMIRLASVG